MKFKILLEKLETYIYPENPSQEMADFYVLEFMNGKIDSNKTDFLEDDVLFIEDSIKTLLPKLKNNLLSDLAFSISREIFHAYDRTSESHPREKIEQLQVEIKQLKEDAIEEAKHLFITLSWSSLYGGEAWGRICEGWLRLNNTASSDNKKLFLSIDNVYDLQHNTGSAFNKVSRYNVYNSETGLSDYNWIQSFLDLKYESKTIWDLYPYTSHTLKPVLARMFYKLGYGSKEYYDQIVENTKQLADLIRSKKDDLKIEEFKQFIEKGIFIHYNKEIILKCIINYCYTNTEILEEAFKTGANAREKTILWDDALLSKFQLLDIIIKNGKKFTSDYQKFQKLNRIIDSDYYKTFKVIVENRDLLELSNKDIIYLAYYIGRTAENPAFYFQILLQNKLVKSDDFIDSNKQLLDSIIRYRKENKQLDITNSLIEIFNRYEPNLKYKQIDKNDLSYIVLGTYKEENGVINVDGSVDLSNRDLEEIPYKFGKVTGNFKCSNNLLKSLKNCPIEVGDFNCEYNDIETLEGAPTKVQYNFNCGNNKKLKSLKGGPTKVGTTFFCSKTSITSLKDAPEQIGFSFMCFFNTRLTSLEGAPKKIPGSFNCSMCKLETLKGAPEEVLGEFDCEDNKLTSLEYLPKKIQGYLSCVRNSKQFMLTDIPPDCELKGNFYS
jgi:hypothetical protein